MLEHSYVREHDRPSSQAKLCDNRQKQKATPTMSVTYERDVFDRILAAMRSTPQNISYSGLRSVCVHYFGEPRQSGTSYAVFKTPWPATHGSISTKPKGGKAKPYQVRQVLKPIDKLNEEHA